MKLITTNEAAHRLGISARRVRALISAGRIVAVEVNPRLKLIDKRELAKVKNRKAGRPKK